MIKVLIVDDSTFMRSAIKRMFQDETDIKIVAEAKNGKEGLEMAELHKPDVITLDIEMPVCNGLEMLEKLMQTNPTPVVMLSSLTTQDAEPTLRALELGALDFMPKYKEGSSSVHDVKAELIEKVRIFSKRAALMRLRKPRVSADTSSTTTTSSGISRLQSTSTATSSGITRLKTSAPSTTSTPSAQETVQERIERRAAERAAANSSASSASPSSSASSTPPPRSSSQDISEVLTLPNGAPRKQLVGIGISTGGPPAIQKVLTAFPKEFPACILIAQHMPASFTGAFAARLNSLCEIEVKEAATGDPLSKGTAYVCPGGKHIKIEMRKNLPYLVVTENPTDALYKPSANVLFESLAEYTRYCVGVMMTGMGNDGVEGMKVFKQKNGKVIAQDEESCVVYGMPKAVVDAGLADEVVPLEKIASRIVKAMYE